MTFLKPFTAFSLSLSKFTTSLWRPTYRGSRLKTPEGHPTFFWVSSQGQFPHLGMEEAIK